MPDREKLIRGLQNRINESRNHGGIAVHVALSTLSGALALLKEQKAVEPDASLMIPGLYYCGNCGAELIETENGYKPNYCSYCGRKVKWNEAD